LGQERQALQIGAGGLGYVCTTTIEGTTCKCNPDVTDPMDAYNCHGMTQHCADKGAKHDCTSSPGWCTCKYDDDKVDPTPPKAPTPKVGVWHEDTIPLGVLAP
jgi:hypothetical protein